MKTFRKKKKLKLPILNRERKKIAIRYFIYYYRRKLVLMLLRTNECTNRAIGGQQLIHTVCSERGLKEKMEISQN